MPLTESLADFRTRALEYADMASSSFPDTTQLNHWINSSVHEFHNLLAGNVGMADYVYSTTTISLVAGTETYNLPSGFFKMLGCYYLSNGNSRRYPLERFERRELAGFKKGAIRSGTIEVEYFPLITDEMVENTDEPQFTYPFSGLWIDWVALNAAIKLLIKEESDPSILMAERDRLWMQMVDASAPQDIAGKGRVEDVGNRFSHAANYGEYRDLRYRITYNPSDGRAALQIVEFEIQGA